MLSNCYDSKKNILRRFYNDFFFFLSELVIKYHKNAILIVAEV